MSDRSARSQDPEEIGALAQPEMNVRDDSQEHAMPVEVSGIGSKIADSEAKLAPRLGLERSDQLVAPLHVPSGESDARLAEQLAAANPQLQDLRLAAIQQAQELNALQNILQTRTTELSARDKKVPCCNNSSPSTRPH